MATKNTTIKAVVTPTSASGVQIPGGTSPEFRGLTKYDWFTLDASLDAPTDGTLDVYLQRYVRDQGGATGVWRDWAHLPQQSAAGTLTHYTVVPLLTATAITVGTGSDGGATPAMAADTYVGGHPGETLRVVLSRGASGTGGLAAQTIRLTCWQGRD